MKFRKKPIIVEAMQWTGDNLDEIMLFCNGDATYEVMASGNCLIVILTSEGRMSANIGDWIIKEPFDKERKFYPCKPDIFEATYEKVEE
jgi:hypothetical protein